jgi:hypothetical protein
MALSSSQRLLLQPYPREGQSLLSANSLFPRKTTAIAAKDLEVTVDLAFQRCIKNKKGDARIHQETPQSIVASTVKHLKERSDPILSPYFLGLLKAEDIFELDAVSYEMQRHRMTIGVFYQYLILELMRKSWHVFDGSREGDVVADIDTPDFDKGLRLYMSVKKSKDTVGGQDVSGVIRRLESEAKAEKNLSRPYLCVIAIATPSKGKLKGYDDRTTKADKGGKAYSLNCEFWGPGFIFPYITGLEAIEIYITAIRLVSNYLPFMTLKFKTECSILLQKELEKLDLLDSENKIDQHKYLKFIVG